MSVERLWQEFLTIVKEEVGTRVVETWFRSVRFVHWDARDKKAYLEAPNAFIRDWVHKHYQALLCKHLARLLSESAITVSIAAHDSQTSAPRASSVPTEHLRSAPQDEPLAVIPAVVSTPEPSTTQMVRVPAKTRVERDPYETSLHQHYVFSTFVVGPSNKLAFAAAQAVAERVGELYNPLFIYGPSGLGKTHLLHAIGNQVKQTRPHVVILYQPAERFVQEFIHAIRFDKVYQFESRYKNVDVLLVDDIQFIANKEQTQEMFFHIFNMLHQLHKQIVVTSDSMPCDIIGLAHRMRSRLEGGLVVDIQMPPLETMIAILHRKAELNGHPIPDDVAQFIASSVVSSVRELEGALIRVMAFASLTHQPISIELAQKVLSPRQEVVMSARDFSAIAKVVSSHYGYSLQQLRSSDRSKELARARHVAMYLMKKYTNRSLREIGGFLERADHTTVMHAYERISMQCEKDQEFAQQLHQLERHVRKLHNQGSAP